MSVSLSRDRVGELLLLLDTTDGRDKLARLIFFACKYLRWKETQQRHDQLAATYSNLQQSMAMVQQVLAFGRSVALLRQLQRQLPVLTSDFSTDLALNSVAKVFFIVCTTLDHIGYLQKVGVVKAKGELVTKIGAWTNGTWLGGLMCSLLEQLIKLHALSNHSVPVTAATTTTSALVTGPGVVVAARGFSTAPAPESALAAAKHETLRALARNALDIPIALHFLGYTDDQPDGHFGVLGVVTSLLAIYDIWPTVYETKPKVMVA